MLNFKAVGSEILAGGLPSCKRDPRWLPTVEGRNLPLPLNQDPFSGDRQSQLLYFPDSCNFEVSNSLEDTFYSPLMPIYNE